MTPRARRGRRVFLTLAAMIAFEQAAVVIWEFSRGFESIRWSRSVAQPLCLALSVAFLWQGQNWPRWLVSISCLLWGGAKLAAIGYLTYRLIGVTPRDQLGFFFELLGLPLLLVAWGALFYVTAGLAFLLSPSMREFFAHQREASRRYCNPAWSATVEPDESPD